MRGQAWHAGRIRTCEPPLEEGRPCARKPRRTVSSRNATETCHGSGKVARPFLAPETTAGYRGVMSYLSFKEAARAVLEEAGEPLSYKEITRQALRRVLVMTAGRTPEASVNAQLSVDISRKGDESIFVRTAPGVFWLPPMARPGRHPAPTRPGKTAMLSSRPALPRLRQDGSAPTDTRRDAEGRLDGAQGRSQRATRNRRIRSTGPTRAVGSSSD